MTVTTRLLAESPGNPRRLGRHVEHDERSRDFEFGATVIKSKPTLWAHHGPVLNQGEVGSCTGNALAQVLACGPLYQTGYHPTEQLALEMYELATELDGVPGTYPPDDTGSSGLAAAKAAKRLGLIRGYQHVFGITRAQAAIQVTPFAAGTVWYDGEFEVDADGFVHPTGGVAGGHEYVVLGWDPTSDVWTCLQSWGRWGIGIRGVATYGLFKVHGADFAAKLKQQGDIIVPVR